MINKNQAVLGLISLVVLASGCTQGGSTTEVTQTPNTGITIQQFSVFPSDVRPGGQTQLTLRIQNTGGATASNVNATIYGLSWAGSGEGTAQQWGYDGQEDTVAASGSNADPVFNDFGNLRPPNPDAGIPSTSREKTLTINAPSRETGLSTSQPILADLWFDYNTTSQAQIVLMRENQFQDQRPTRGRPSVQNSAGPIQVSIRTESPIILRGADGADDRSVCFVVNNVGTGTPYTDEGQNTVEITADVPNGDIVSDTVTLSQQTGQGGICADNLGETVGNVRQEATVPITVETEYSYKKSTESSISIDQS